MRTKTAGTVPGKSAEPWYKQGWPWFLMAFPAIAVVAGFITLWLAIRSWDGLVVDDYYQEGKMIEQAIGRTVRARELGLLADLKVGAETIEVDLSRGAGAAEPPTLVVTIAHPTQGGHDQKLLLKKTVTGSFAASLAPLTAGRWLVVVEDESRTWRLAGEMHVPDQIQVRIEPPQS